MMLQVARYPSEHMVAMISFPRERIVEYLVDYDGVLSHVSGITPIPWMQIALFVTATLLLHHTT